MSASFPFRLLEAASELAGLGGWSEEVYQDLLALQDGRMSGADFDTKYLRRKAILALDMTGFTSHCIQQPSTRAFLRILDVQKICIPALQEHAATLIRTFADDLVALFAEPGQALDAAFQIHHRVTAFHESGLAGDEPAQCCIGIGFGDVYAIGPNRAMGDEMNRASKLGEDIARGYETLVTSNVVATLRHREDVRFEPQKHDDMLFPYFRATRAS